MIYWLIGSSSEQPELAQGVAPAGLLNSEENGQLNSFPTPKRRHDWLLGRWTAKHLVQTVLEEQAGCRLPLEALHLQNGADGAPFAFIEPRAGLAGPLADLTGTVSLSISHCDEVAFCALYANGLRGAPTGLHALHRPGNGAGHAQVGADIEHIAPRSPGFVDDYFSPAESAWVRQAPPGWHDTLVNAIWSTKEAVLKAFHVGLTVDTRRVSCLVSPLPPGSRAWMNIDVRCDPGLLRVAGDQNAAVCAWWRIMGDYVLTLAALTWGGKKGIEPARPVDYLHHPTFPPPIKPILRPDPAKANTPVFDP